MAVGDHHHHDGVGHGDGHDDGHDNDHYDDHHDDGYHGDGDENETMICFRSPSEFGGSLADSDSLRSRESNRPKLSEVQIMYWYCDGYVKTLKGK